MADPSIESAKGITDREFLELAIKSVRDYENEMLPVVSQLTSNDVYVVWYCHTLRNSKALLSTVVPDGMYYEFTWDGEKNRGYLDAYKKKENKVVERT